MSKGVELDIASSVTLGLLPRNYGSLLDPRRRDIHFAINLEWARLRPKSSQRTRRGRICLGRKKINFSQVFAGQAVGIKDVHDDNWLVSFMDDDLGYFDLKTRVLEPPENPFGPKVLPM